jgi:hypothetical protein
MIMTQVLIKSGTYGHGNNEKVIVDTIFPLAKEYTESSAGRYVTVIGSKAQGLEDRKCRIKVADINCFEYIANNGQPVAAHFATMTAQEQYTATESDEAAMERIANTFSMLDEMTDATAQGIVRGMVISGPPGIGKSYGVMKTLEEANFHLRLKDKEEQYEVIKGSASAIGLYKKLYLNRKAGFVTVLDDCDSVLFDEQSLNLLKAALDSGEKRRLSWLAESSALRKEDIPDTFDFEGSIIFLTNLDFERTKSSKLSAHLEAIVSRCHYIDLEVSGLRDQLLRIKQIVRAGMLDKYSLSTQEKHEVVEFIFENAEHLKEISLRTVKKAADLAQAAKKGSLKRDWKDLAEMTMLRSEAKYAKRLAKA